MAKRAKETSPSPVAPAWVDRISSETLAWAIFAAVAAFLLIFQARWILLTNDEGIILDAAQRMSQGQIPYVDFFGYMSPGSYWLQTLVFELAGVSLLTGRLIVILDFAAQCALVFLLTSYLGGRRAATATTLAFFGFQIADPGMLTAQHRWDSATFALGGVYVLLTQLDRHRERRSGDSFGLKLGAAGLLLAAACWSTPSMVLVAGAIFLGLLWNREWRPALAQVLGGYMIGGLAGLSVLASRGNLRPFLDQLAWLQQNYASVNVMPYGSIIGGYGDLLDAGNTLEFVLQLVLVAGIALPAILPPLAALMWAGTFRKPPAEGGPARAEVFLLLAVVAALVGTTFPRADVTHLAWVAAIPYALAGAGIARNLPMKFAGAIASFTVAIALLFGSNFVRQWTDTVPVTTAAGGNRVSRQQASALTEVSRQVRPGDSLFVYPYMPVLYFLTQAENPTEFSYLAPGMMTAQEERRTLESLKANPPEWVLHLELAEQEFHRVFPTAPANGWHFAELEGWIKSHYKEKTYEGNPVSVGGYRLMQRRLRTDPGIPGEQAGRVRISGQAEVPKPVSAP